MWPTLLASTPKPKNIYIYHLVPPPPPSSVYANHHHPTARPETAPSSPDRIGIPSAKACGSPPGNFKRALSRAARLASRHALALLPASSQRSGSSLFGAPVPSGFSGILLGSSKIRSYRVRSTAADARGCGWTEVGLLVCVLTLAFAGRRALVFWGGRRWDG